MGDHRTTYIQFQFILKLITHRSPQDPDAILSPIFNVLISISQSPGFACDACATGAFAVADWECDEPDQERYKFENTS